MKKIIAVFLGLVILAGLVYYLISHGSDLRKLLHVSFANILIFILSFFSMQFFNGLRTRLILGKKGIGLNMSESFHLAIISAVANYLPIKSGTFTTAIYLKRRYAFSYMDFAKLFLASQILLFITITIATTLCILFHYLLTGIFLYRIFWLFMLLSVTMLIVIFLLLHIAKRNLYSNSGWQKALEEIDALRSIFADKDFTLRLLMLNCAVIIAIGIRVIASFNIVSFKATPLLPFVAGQVQTLATLLSIVPAGLGIAEFSTGIMSELMGMGLDIGIYAASVDRIISVLLLLLISSVSFLYIYRYALNTGKRLE